MASALDPAPSIYRYQQGGLGPWLAPPAPPFRMRKNSAPYSHPSIVAAAGAAVLAVGEPAAECVAAKGCPREEMHSSQRPSAAREPRSERRSHRAGCLRADLRFAFSRLAPIYSWQHAEWWCLAALLLRLGLASAWWCCCFTSPPSGAGGFRSAYS